MACRDDVIDSFTPSITQIERQVNEIDDSVYTTRLDDMQSFLRTIEDARRRVLNLVRLLSSKTDILRTFSKHYSDRSNNPGEDAEELPAEQDIERHTSPGEDIRLYIDDVQDHVTTMMSSLLQFEGLLSRSQNNYLAQLSIDSLTGKQRVHRFMSKIAVITLILTLVNVICGLFSQNVNANISLYTDNTYLPWALIVSGEAVIAVALFLGARRFRLF
jgi:Mg2+ and Co2+ transporter CorA